MKSDHSTICHPMSPWLVRRLPVCDEVLTLCSNAINYLALDCLQLNSSITLNPGIVKLEQQMRPLNLRIVKL